MTTSPQPDRVTAIYDAIDAFQRQHRTVGGLQHAQIRALLAEHLDRALPSAPVTATAPPDDRAALRDRIAEVLWPLTDWDGDQLNAEAAADAVLAVLPAPADRAAVLREAADELPDADLPFVSPMGRRQVAEWLRHRAEEISPMTIGDAQSMLRRMADEARQDGEAHPAEHTWAAELYDPVAEEWVPGIRYSVRERAVNHLEHAAKIGPKWKDGAPTQRRLVRATTTYTVEQPTAGARQDGAQQP